jgi:hypothetical protein
LQEDTTMPSFDTPDPITATIDVALGDVRISAVDGHVTRVDVRPTDATDDEDVQAAESTRVEYAHGRLEVRGPRMPWMTRTSRRSIEVTIELPAGSAVHGTGKAADFHTDGRLGACQIKTGVGRIELDQAGTLSLKSGIGDISVDHASGHTDVSTGSGDVRVRELDDTAVIKNSNGDTWVGVAGGDVRLNAANGDIAVDLAQASVVATIANGDVRLREVVRGTVVLETRLGDLEIGIRKGTVAWLDASVKAGTVDNALEEGAAPEPSAETVEVRARTTVGTIAIRRP